MSVKTGTITHGVGKPRRTARSTLAKQPVNSEQITLLNISRRLNLKYYVDSYHDYMNIIELKKLNNIFGMKVNTIKVIKDLELQFGNRLTGNYHPVIMN